MIYGFMDFRFQISENDLWIYGFQISENDLWISENDLWISESFRVIKRISTFDDQSSTAHARKTWL